MEQINLIDFQKRKLQKFYVAMYVVPKEIRIRAENCIASRLLYVIFGVDIMGNKQVLGMYFNNENDSRFWLERFESLKNRDIDKILFFVTPPDKNIERCVKIIYNNVKIIHSPDTMYSSIMKYFPQRPSRKMQIDLRNLFFAEDIQKYKVELELFKENYLDNKVAIMLLEKQRENIESFYKYNHSLRKLLYPYFSIRDMQKELNKIKTREVLCTSLNEVIESFLPYIHSFELGRSYSKSEWLKVISDIYDENKDVLEEYLNG